MCVCVCTFVCDTCTWGAFGLTFISMGGATCTYCCLISYLKQAFLEGSREGSLAKCHHMYGHISLQNVQICSSHVEEITLCVIV